MRSFPTLVVIVVAAGVALTACGRSSSTSTSVHWSSALTAAHCMRAHGVPNFPDPGPRGGMSVVFSAGSSTPTIDGIRFTGPAFAAAAKVCRPFGAPRPGGLAVSVGQQRALLEFAACMRRHGLPQWADPSFPPGGGVMGGGGPYKTSSPTVARASKLCNGATRSSRGRG